MPQVNFDFDNDIKNVALWKITEKIGELEALCIGKFNIPIEINQWNTNRKLQWLSSRLLLNKLAQKTEFLFSQEKGPIETNNKTFVSVSHTNWFSCAITSEKSSVGIDIEEINDKAKKISKKFLHASEFQFLQHENVIESTFYTLLWTIKEALFKKYYYLHLVFSEQIILKSLSLETSFINAIVVIKTNDLTFETSTKIYTIENHFLCIAT
jgi:4'-phosphopantetheinyl transferase EntD